MSSTNGNVFDKDLNPILKACTNDELQFLVDLLKGTFTNSLKLEEVYRNYYPNHKRYSDILAAHIRRFGGNSFANCWRGMKSQDPDYPLIGPDYREIVGDVAERLKVQFNKNSSIDEIELLILIKITEQFLSKATEEQKMALLKEMSTRTGKEMKDISTALSKIVNGEMTASEVITKLLVSGGLAGFLLMSLASHRVLFAMVGKGLPTGIFSGIAPLLPIYPIQIGWMAASILVIGISSPAFRITVPAVIYIAILRRHQKLKQNGIVL